MDYDKKIAEKKGDIIYWQRKYNRQKTDYARMKIRQCEERLRSLEWDKAHQK